MGFWDTVAFDEVGGIKVRDPDTIQIMKDFMANGRFSRGAEVIADASLAFVGNIDLSVRADRQLARSTTCSMPLPPEFDLAVMDRFACYLPGWEMPKNSSAFLTDRYGFITDYLAEAFHYQFKHTQPLRGGQQAHPARRGRRGPRREGHQEDASAPSSRSCTRPATPTDEEFEEYVAYAVECRRRVKEQMNKRKPDDEFAQHRPLLHRRRRAGGGGSLPGIEERPGDPGADASPVVGTGWGC